MKSVACAECDRRWNTSVALLLEYSAALNVLALTRKNYQAYGNRWTELADLSERVAEAQRRELRHRVSHSSS